jgi:hypothetical protein
MRERREYPKSKLPVEERDRISEVTLGDVALFKSSEESNGGGTPLLFCLSISSV